ncbi:MAG: DinB family protein [candidate division Zixibacteria bacterium]
MKIVDELKKSHLDLLEAIDGLDSAQLAKENTIGNWSVRDIILHIAMWEGEVLKALAIWRMGHKVDWSYVGDEKTILRFNDFWIENMKHLSVEKVIQLFNLTHSAIVAEVSSISEDIWESRGGVPEWIPSITTEHNNHHIKKILAYRKH